MRAAEPAEAAPERVADDADVGRGAGQRAQSVLARRLGELQGEHACLDPRRAGLGVDLDPAHPLGLEQDRSLERRQGRGAVAGALAGDLEAVLGGEADGRGDVLGALDEGDGDRPLVGGEVPGQPRLVPVGVGGGGDPADDRQPGEVGQWSLLEESAKDQFNVKRFTASPSPTSTSLTISAGKRPCAATPGSASRRAARVAGSPISPR